VIAVAIAAHLCGRAAKRSQRRGVARRQREVLATGPASRSSQRAAIASTLNSRARKRPFSTIAACRPGSSRRLRSAASAASGVATAR
jgi:hypothetical protein